MLADIPWLDTVDFARIPAKWAKPRPSHWASGVLGVDSIGSFLEGPCFRSDGALFVSDLAHGRIFTVSRDGEVDLFLEYDGQPNGLAFDPNGRLLVADYRHGLCIVDANSRSIDPLVTGYRLEPFRGLSDIVVARNGSVYFSDYGQSDLRHPTGRIFRYDPTAQLEMLMDNVASPNGMALSPDESMLYVAVTRANCVYRLPLRPSGEVGKVGVHLYSAGGTGGPDGLAVDDTGGLAVAQYGAGRVWLFDELGLVTTAVLIGSGRGTTNVAYGVLDPAVIFVTEAHTGSILMARTPRNGHPLTGVQPSPT